MSSRHSQLLSRKGFDQGVHVSKDGDGDFDVDTETDAHTTVTTTTVDSCQISPLKNGFENIVNNTVSKNVRTSSQSVDSNNQSHLRSRTYANEFLYFWE